MNVAVAEEVSGARVTTQQQTSRLLHEEEVATITPPANANLTEIVIVNQELPLQHFLQAIVSRLDSYC